MLVSGSVFWIYFCLFSWWFFTDSIPWDLSPWTTTMWGIYIYIFFFSNHLKQIQDEIVFFNLTWTSSTRWLVSRKLTYSSNGKCHLFWKYIFIGPFLAMLVDWHWEDQGMHMAMCDLHRKNCTYTCTYIYIVPLDDSLFMFFWAVRMVMSIHEQWTAIIPAKWWVRNKVGVVRTNQFGSYSKKRPFS